MYLHGGMPHLNHEKALSQMLLGMISSWPNFCIHSVGLNLQEKPPLLAEKSWLQQLSRRGKFCMREWMRGMHGMRGLPRPMRGGWQVWQRYESQFEKLAIAAAERLATACACALQCAISCRHHTAITTSSSDGVVQNTLTSV